MPAGKVYIVGAGPGDPKLLTLRAVEALQEADIVIYDRLVSAPILRKIPRRAVKNDAGKEPGSEEPIQDRINELMVKEAKRGKTVVRLKGGDPIIFSRGGEEAEFLRSHGVEFEIVPGVTSAIGVPAYAGIPLTHRDYSSSVTILTGHEVKSKGRGKIDWSKIAGSSDTLVVLMGAANLRKISRALLEAGLEPSTPLAAITWGTTKEQETSLLTLAECSKERAAVRAPSVIVIGEVVVLASKLRWYKDKLNISPAFEALLRNRE